MNKTFKEIQAFLNENYAFGFTVSRRKKYLIYTFVRFFNSKRKLHLRMKVDRETKQVISVNHQGKVYTDFDELKKLIEQ